MSWHTCTVMPRVIEAAKATGVSRVVVLSALGWVKPLPTRATPYRFGCSTFLAGNFGDHVAGESCLVGSGLNWTTMHPGLRPDTGCPVP